MFFGERKLFSLDKKTADDCKIYQMLKNSASKEKQSLHTPGHKLVGWDITELSYSDNLACPNGCIKAAQEDVAKLLGATASFLLTDGSTSGILAMLYAAKKLGVNKLAVPYLSHKSVFNGCKLMGIQPIVFGKENDGKILKQPTRVEMNEALNQADALFLTSPDYYGNVADLAYARAICDGEKKWLLVDGAHGGHLRFNKQKHASSFAHFWVDGVHKSLPALTQGSVVSAQTQSLAEALKEGVDIFRTTSPSYPIMASVEFAVKFPQNARLEAQVEKFKKKHQEYFYQNDDWTKLCLLAGERAAETQQSLEKQGVYAEFCDGKIIMFYLSPAMRKRQFQLLKRRLKRVIETLAPYREETQRNVVQQLPTPYAFKKTQTEWVELKESEGRICAKTFGRFPPCLPVKREGELITKESVQKMQGADNIFGLDDGKVLVYKTEGK